MRDISREELLELLEYNNETGVFVWRQKVGRQGGPDKSGTVAGTITRAGYRQITIAKRPYQAHRLAWLYVHGVMPTLYVDHIDGDKTNNAISNLRLATPRQNQVNRDKSKSNKSGVVGVSYDARHRKWRAAVSTENDGPGRQSYKRYATFEEACAARREAERRVYQEFSFEALQCASKNRTITS